MPGMIAIGQGTPWPRCSPIATEAPKPPMPARAKLTTRWLR